MPGEERVLFQPRPGRPLVRRGLRLPPGGTVELLDQAVEVGVAQQVRHATDCTVQAGGASRWTSLCQLAQARADCYTALAVERGDRPRGRVGPGTWTAKSRDGWEWPKSLDRTGPAASPAPGGTTGSGWSSPRRSSDSPSWNIG